MCELFLTPAALGRGIHRLITVVPGRGGFDFLMISHPEWQALRPGLQWVRLYGNLHVYVTDGITAAGLGLPEGLQNDRKDHSPGNIQIIRWDGRSATPTSTLERHLGARSGRQMPVAMPDPPWAKLKSSSNSQVVQLAQAGPPRSGNYFQSRTQQAQVLVFGTPVQP